MLNQLINRVGKLQKKLLIIINFLALTFITAAQNTSTDTAAFKKDFEDLLRKYGIKSKGYQINVTSINQKGGQTALIINNNYFSDTLTAKNNFGFWIDTINNQKILICGPNKGVWITPFFAMDSIKYKTRAYDPGIGLVTSIHGIYATIDNKEYSLAAVASNNSCSRMFPMKIYLSALTAEDFFLFGDLQDPLKTYLYTKGEVWYFGDEGDGQKKGIH